MVHPTHDQPLVLLVEDDLMMREFLGFLLHDTYRVITCATLAAADDALRSITTVDVVITDAALPDGDAYAFVASLRRHERHAAVPVLMVSSRMRSDERLAALDAGVDDYLTKPFDPRELALRLRRLLRTSPVPVS